MSVWLGGQFELKSQRVVDRHMIQTFVEQRWLWPVSSVDPINIETFMPLDPAKTTVIREIDTHEAGGMTLADAPNLSPVAFSKDAFVRARVIATNGFEQVLYPPSHVRSPSFPAIGTITLWILAEGYKFDPPALVAVRRAIGAHLYVDQY
jgi:hypothetical protein